MTRTHLKIVPASLVATAAALITQLVAFVPELAPAKEQLISTAGIVIPAAFLIANSLIAAVHAFVMTKATPGELADGLRGLVADELGKVDLGPLVKDAVNGHLTERTLRDLVGEAFARLAGTPATPAAPTPTAPVAAPATYYGGSPRQVQTVAPAAAPTPAPTAGGSAPAPATPVAAPGAANPA